MAVVNIGHDYAEWMPSGSFDKPGRGRIILRSATRLTELFRSDQPGFGGLPQPATYAANRKARILGQRSRLAAHRASADARCRTRGRAGRQLNRD